MKSSPPDIVTEITNSAENRVLTVGTVHDETQQDLNAEANLTFDGSTLTVAGNLTVTGTTTTISTTNTLIADRLIELGNGASTGADSGIIIERGSTGDNAAIVWDESRDEFVLCTTTATGASTGDVTFTPANVSVERIGAGTEQAEAEVHAKRDTASGPTYSTTATVISEDDARPAVQLVGSANNIGMIQFGDNAAAASGQVYYDHSTDKLRIDAGGNSDRITVDANGDLTVARNLDVDGTANLDAVDIDGAVQIDGTVTVGANDQGYDVIFYGDTASANMTWDTSADDLILNGAARIVVPEGQLVVGSTAVTSTAAELNLLDGKSFVDEDDMSSNSATAIASQQSIKAYVDAQVTAQDLDATTDSGTIAIDLDSETLTIAGGEGIDTSATGNTITIACEDSTANNKGAVIVAGGTDCSVSYSSGTATVNVDNLGAAKITSGTFDDARIAASNVTQHQASITGVGTIASGTWQGTAIASAYLDADTAHLSGTQTFTGAKTFSDDVVISGTTPKLTIGDAGAEDTMLVFDGAAADFRIGIDDGTDTLEIGKGSAHGTDAVIKIADSTNLTMLLNSAVADGEYSGNVAVFEAAEALSAGEVVYLNGQGKMAKAVATAAATSRCVAMAVADISANAMGAFLLEGFVRFNSNFPTWTVGGAIYTPEAEQNNLNVPEQTAPDTDGDFVQVIGFAVSADALYFRPDSTVVEVA